MTLPVSSYEELLNKVRSLTHETRQLQRQIDAPLLDHNENERQNNAGISQSPEWTFKPRVDSFTPLDSNFTSPTSQGPVKDVGTRWTKEQGASPEAKEQEETSPHSQGSCDGGLSYSYSYSSEQLGTKVEMVYNLLSMLGGSHDKGEMTATLLAMSSSPDSCRAMRQSGCLSLLVQLVHSSGTSRAVRERAGQALRNMVLCHGEDRRGRREARVLRLLDQIIAYTDALQANPQSHQEEGHPGPAIAALMKLSFDEEHRLAMCQLGALYVVAKLVQVESGFNLDCCITVKRYALMALTNLTFGDGNNKALLCSMKPFMTALVSQLSSSSEDLTQVTASVLRNLSWRADANSKQALREVGSVPALMKAAMSATKEPTLKSVLSALWNLSAHCSLNKVDICAVDGALQYLVEMLNYQSPSKTLTVIENAGGILRNISSHIAVREDYRKILREENCLAILLRQLQSASLTVVSNACGTLWNLSARCGADQKTLVTLGAVPMLTSLAHSRHRMIAMGASAALKNLLPVRLAQAQHHQAASGGATLSARKRRALEAELNSSLSETCDNIEPCPNWDSEREITVSQSKDNCDQINHSMQQLTIDETTEQPVNYSIKFRESESSETKVSESENDAVNYSIKFKESVEPEEEKPFHANGCFDKKVVSEGDYAETDLDQPTDYSLRYNDEEQLEASAPPAPIKCDDSEKDPADVPNSVEASPGKILNTGKGANLETPLMFSRCSSLGSVSSIEQQDDGHSSVVSEFSRMTSGIMSPSELPDSPTQTFPPSPRTKAPPPVLPPPPVEKIDKRAGVFEDTVLAFKVENTPAQFSTATSLSDLTFEDEPHETIGERKDLELAVVSEEEDEKVLASCINIGMNNTRNTADVVTPTSATSRIPRVSGIPVKASPRTSQNLDEIPIQFCTEDTPASLSHATSHSELSVALSDPSSDIILADVIQSGMPQTSPLSSEKKHSLKLMTPAPGVKVAIVKPRPVSIPAPRMRQLVAEDEVKAFATEGSPGNFSIRSSLSDLTINSKPERNEIETPPMAPENPSPLSSLEPDADEGEAVTVLSANSGDDVTLADQEDQAILMQLISSGMPSVGDKMKESTDTWAEETGEFSLPSRSDTEKTDEDLTLTESRVIPLENGKVALISHLEMEGSYLEETQPPSNMASILSLSCDNSLSVSDFHQPPKPNFKLNDSLRLDSVQLSSVGGKQKNGKDSKGNLSSHERVEKGVKDSSIIPLENGKVALISHLEMEGSYLEETQPPSNMASILSLSCDNSLSVSDFHQPPKPNFKLNDSITQDLDTITPPHSGMDSIISLTCSLDGDKKKTGDWSLLENVKPPPEMDDLLDLDNSMISVASLKSELAETPPSQRRLTPKQRRDLGAFRYNTYVIKGDEKSGGKPSLSREVSLEEGAKSMEEDAGDSEEGKDKTKERITPKQRRQADRERFRTRTIHDIPPSLDRLSSEESCPADGEPDADPEPEQDSPSEADEPPRPVVVKPPEVKSIRGGGQKTSAIPIVKTTPKKKPAAAIAPIQRQGTFTKEEPSSSIPIPVRKVTSPMRKIPIGASKSTGNCSNSGLGRGRAGSLPNKSGTVGGGGVRASSSNQSLKSAASGVSEASSGQRWSSNSSLNSQPVSKVAALWKKVDEAKKKQPAKDTRVWVQPEPKNKQVV